MEFLSGESMALQADLQLLRDAAGEQVWEFSEWDSTVLSDGHLPGCSVG